jgi:hypothetical protein
LRGGVFRLRDVIGTISSGSDSGRVARLSSFRKQSIVRHEELPVSESSCGAIAALKSGVAFGGSGSDGVTECANSSSSLSLPSSSAGTSFDGLLFHSKSATSLSSSEAECRSKSSAAAIRLQRARSGNKRVRYLPKYSNSGFWEMLSCLGAAPTQPQSTTSTNIKGENKTNSSADSLLKLPTRQCAFP